MKNQISQENSGKLYIVGTPIGNLEDITLRAIRVLSEVDFIASEDTRHTRKLLSHLSLSKPLISYYKEKELRRSDEIIQRLSAGESGALVSDAGTPAVSDPGAVLVNKCYEHNIPVVPIPGPSSLTAAISVAGFEHTSFVFLGFLPGQQGKRRKMLTRYCQHQELIIFFETAKRIRKTVSDCLDIFGNRQMVLAREITKIYEEIVRGTIADVADELESRHAIKGECVVLLCGTESAPTEQVDTSDLAELLRWYRDELGSSLKDAVDKVVELGGKMEHGEDFGADEEALLTKEIDRPLFVHKYPKDIKAFYMKEDPKNPELVLNNDLLAPRGHGEIIGGSERIWDYDELISRMKAQKLDLKDYQWYIDLRKYGSVPHSGYGLGIERLCKWILNLNHIRDTIPFPRTITRCYP